MVFLLKIKCPHHVVVVLSSRPEDHHGSRQHPGVRGQHSRPPLRGVRRQRQHRLVQVQHSL